MVGEGVGFKVSSVPFRLVPLNKRRYRIKRKKYFNSIR